MVLKNCPECGTDLKTVDPYKHAIACFHLTPGRLEDVLAAEEAKGNLERYKRIVALLKGAE